MALRAQMRAPKNAAMSKTRATVKAMARLRGRREGTMGSSESSWVVRWRRSSSSGVLSGEVMGWVKSKWDAQRS